MRDNLNWGAALRRLKTDSDSVPGRVVAAARLDAAGRLSLRRRAKGSLEFEGARVA